MRTILAALWCALAMSTLGCSSEEPARTDYAMRDLHVEGELGTGPFLSTDGTITMVDHTADLGTVSIYANASDGLPMRVEQTFTFSPEILGIAPGTRVELEGGAEGLVATSVVGDPSLEALTLVVESIAADLETSEDLIPERVIVTAEEGEGVFVHIRIECIGAEVDTHALTSELDVAIFAREDDPSWTGQRWENTPIIRW